jgi:hypothetical protein
MDSVDIAINLHEGKASQTTQNNTDNHEKPENDADVESSKSSDASVNLHPSASTFDVSDSIRRALMPLSRTIAIGSRYPRLFALFYSYGRGQ